MIECSDKTDEEILLSYLQSKNPQLLNILFSRYADVGFRTAMRYMRNESDAEDVLQLAFIHFLQNLHFFREGKTTVKPWLMKMIVNTSIDKLREEKRRSKRQQNVASERFNKQELNPDQKNVDNEELKNKIKSSVDTLPEKYRSPIWLVLYEGFTYPEVAEVLALPEKTVRTQVSRGLERLREILGSLGSILSVALIIELISASRLDAAPTTIKEIIDSPELYKSVSSNRKSIAGTQKSNNIFKVVLSALFIIAALISLAIWQNKNDTTNKKINSENDPLRISLQFNQSNQVDKYTYKGEYHQLEKGGLDDSGCLEFLKVFIMQFHVEKSQLPLKISYRINLKTDFISDKPGEPLIIWGNWERFGFFTKLSDTLYILDLKGAYLKDDSSWVYETIWVTENSIDIWLNHKRNTLSIFSRDNSNKNLYLVFSKNTKLDNFSLETVNSGQVPDYSEFVKINEDIFKNSKNEFTPIAKYLPEFENSKKVSPLHQKIRKSSENEVKDLLNNFVK